MNHFFWLSCAARQRAMPFQTIVHTIEIAIRRGGMPIKAESAFKDSMALSVLY